jgi:3-(3-hydroxy-phenyl)propionate hydroxylase
MGETCIIQVMDYTLPTYSFTEPPEISEGLSPRHPVVIVGGGLTGLTLACDLSRRGIAVVLLDEDDTVGVRGASSRGICYAQKSLEIFARLGIYPRIKEKGIQWSVGRTFAGTDEVYSFDLVKQSTHNASEQPPFINIQQFYVEWFLVERLHELAPGALRWKNKVTAVSTQRDHVQLQVSTPAGDYACCAQYVVDCTGSNSPIRGALGIAAPRATGIDRWCISDVKFKHKPPIERWTWIEAPFNENRAVWQHLMADNVWRLDYQMSVDDDPDYVSRRDVVEERLRKHFGEDVPFELVWVGPYSYRDLLMDTFRAGRVLFAGDAAHVMSPFGARGGNSGIQDADNLGWKLAHVLGQQAGDTLLDTYAEERREAAHHNITITARTNRFLTPRSPVEKMLRNAVIDLARSHPFARALVNTGRLSSPTSYGASAIALGARAGASIQNVRLDAHQDLVQCMQSLNGRWLIIARDRITANALNALALERDFPVRCAVLKSLKHPLASQLKLSAGEAAFVRPDLHHAGSIPVAHVRRVLQTFFKKTA